MSENKTAEQPKPTIVPPRYPTTLDEVGTFIGRKEIRTTIRRITPENVLDVLTKALAVFKYNVGDIEYLYNYYLGLQPILERVKQYRPEICSKTVVNHASEIVDFFTGYCFGDPIVYAGRNEDDPSEDIQKLNGWNVENDINTVNVEVGTWLNICGIGYKMTVPTRDADEDVADSDMDLPYITSCLDPREAFVVYYNRKQKIPVMGVKVVDTRNSGVEYSTLYCVYTEDYYFEIPNTLLGTSAAVAAQKNPIGRVPIVEYTLNLARRGRIEPVIPICDALNLLASNRMDSIEQFVQAILIFRNVDVNSEGVERLSQMGAIKYSDTDPSMPGEIKYITAELNQEGAQTLKDDLYQSLLIISGMPNRNEGAGDNGVAVIYRDGWSAAEGKAKETERFFERAERNTLRVILSILRDVSKDSLTVNLSNIDIKPTRKNYENIQTKAQVLTQMLGNEKIAPRLAFVYSGLFSDPEAAWKESEEYYDSLPEDQKANIKGGTPGAENTAVTGNGRDNRESAEQRLTGGSQNRAG